MNDWLDYAGSGSSRAYSNTIEHAARSTTISKSNSLTDNGVYSRINGNLDQLYKSTQDLINLTRSLRTSYENMVTAARNTKKNVTLADSKSKMWVAAHDKIDSDIDSANISDIQKTALRNKLNNIESSVDNIIGKLATGMEVDVSMSTLNELINEIQNSLRR